MEHFIEKYSNGPNINFFSLFFSLVNFRGHVLESTTKGIFHISLVNTRPEISQFWAIIFGNQNILRLDIPMDHSIVV